MYTVFVKDITIVTISVKSPFSDGPYVKFWTSLDADVNAVTAILISVDADIMYDIRADTDISQYYY